MKISVVIVNYNTPKDTLECLKSLKQATLPADLELYTTVVDNASKDNSVQQISSKFPEVRLVISGKNMGFAGGNNIGIKAALADQPNWIILLNPDTYIAKDFFVNLANSDSLSLPKVGVICPLIYFAPGFEFHKDRYAQKDLGKVIWYGGGHIDWNNIYASHRHVDEVDHNHFTQPEETDFATGACFIVRSQVIKSVGLLNEDYFLYMEDLEYSQRIKEAGWKIIFDPKPKLWHKVSQTTGGIGSNINDYFITRNRLLFGMQYASFRTKLALLREAITKLKNGTDIQKLAIKDYFFRRYGKGSFLK